MSPRLLALLAAVAAVLAAPGWAAGADLTGAAPAPGGRVPRPPAEIRLSLDAPVEAGLTRMSLTVDGRLARSRPVATGDDQVIALAPEGTGPGTYVVRWRVLAIDGHARAGSYAFAVGPGPAPSAAVVTVDTGDPGPATVVGRTLLIAGLAGLLGLAVLAGWVLGPSLGALPAPGAAAAPVGVRRWRAGVAAAAGATVAGVVSTAGGLAAALPGPGLGGVLDGTRVSIAWLLALVAAAAGAAVAAWAGRSSAWPGAWSSAALALPAAAGLVAVAWSGHAAAGNDPALNIGLDAVHALATGSWLGALAGLGLVLGPLVSAQRPPGRVPVAAAVVVRFSSLAVASVAVLLVTGVYRALAEIATPGDLVSTAYGVALLVKVGLVVVLLGVGAVNRFVVHPRLERAAMGLADDDRGARLILRRSVALELLLGAAVMVAVGFLVSLPAPG